MATLPQYVQDQAKIFPLSAYAERSLAARFTEYGDGPELRQMWENNRDGLGPWYPVKMHLCDIVVDRSPDGLELIDDHIYVRVDNGRIRTFAASADKVEHHQQNDPFDGNGRLEVILHV